MPKKRNRSSWVTLETEVEIDVDEYVNRVSDEALLEEIHERGLNDNGGDSPLVLNLGELSLTQSQKIIEYYKEITTV